MACGAGKLACGAKNFGLRRFHFRFVDVGTGTGKYRSSTSSRWAAAIPTNHRWARNSRGCAKRLCFCGCCAPQKTALFLRGLRTPKRLCFCGVCASRKGFVFAGSKKIHALNQLSTGGPYQLYPTSTPFGLDTNAGFSTDGSQLWPATLTEPEAFLQL
jgi:hypothetical protein